MSSQQQAYTYNSHSYAHPQYLSYDYPVQSPYYNNLNQNFYYNQAQQQLQPYQNFNFSQPYLQSHQQQVIVQENTENQKNNQNISLQLQKDQNFEVLNLDEKNEENQELKNSQQEKVQNLRENSVFEENKQYLQQKSPITEIQSMKSEDQEHDLLQDQIFPQQKILSSEQQIQNLIRSKEIIEKNFLLKSNGKLSVKKVKEEVQKINELQKKIDVLIREQKFNLKPSETEFSQEQISEKGNQLNIKKKQNEKKYEAVLDQEIIVSNLYLKNNIQKRIIKTRRSIKMNQQNQEHGIEKKKTFNFRKIVHRIANCMISYICQTNNLEIIKQIVKKNPKIQCLKEDFVENVQQFLFFYLNKLKIQDDFNKIWTQTHLLQNSSIISYIRIMSLHYLQNNELLRILTQKNEFEISDFLQVRRELISYIKQI